ncbi:MAG: WecB/TagA/CpsF family glycosyltransferase [Alicyclobacillus sp.]|nr:WecB/TagA/CpsF family glycosyltransferase [Alicyclobacillus sp.]
MSFAVADPAAQATVDVLGVRFDVLTVGRAVEQMLLWIAERSSRMVITAGPEFVMMTRQDQELRDIAHRADLVTPDGVGILWAARRQGIVLPERVTGVELVYLLLQTAEQRKQPLRVYILGASQTSLDLCLKKFRDTFPHLTFAGRNGYFHPSHTEAVLAEVAAFRPDLWLVGLGQPRQEKLIFHHLASLPPCVAVGVGGSIDAWSGTVPRAPLLFRKLNLEWLHRLLRQPSRFRRQLALPRFAWQVLRNPASHG